jgi:hypothetical protein
MTSIHQEILSNGTRGFLRQPRFREPPVHPEKADCLHGVCSPCRLPHQLPPPSDIGLGGVHFTAGTSAQSRPHVAGKAGVQSIRGRNKARNDSSNPFGRLTSPGMTIFGWQAKNARTMSGSNWVPEQRRISAMFDGLL